MPSRTAVKDQGVGGERRKKKTKKQSSSHRSSESSRQMSHSMKSHSEHHRRKQHGSRRHDSKDRKRRSRDRRHRNRDSDSDSFESTSSRTSRSSNRHGRELSDSIVYAKHRGPGMGGGNGDSRPRMWRPPSGTSDASESSSAYTLGINLSDDEEDDGYGSSYRQYGSGGQSDVESSNTWKGFLGKLRVGAANRLGSRSLSPARHRTQHHQRDNSNEYGNTYTSSLRDEPRDTSKAFKQMVERTRRSSKHFSEKVGTTITQRFAQLQAHIPPLGRTNTGSRISSNESEDDINRKKSIKQYVKKGGIRKLHTGLLFSIDVAEGPIGIRISEYAQNLKGHIGFEVENIAKAGMAIRGGVQKKDYLVAVGDELLTLDMGWEEAQGLITAAARPLRITFFRPYTKSELARLKARGGLADLECFCAAPSIESTVQYGSGEERLCDTCGGTVSRSQSANLNSSNGPSELLAGSLNTLRKKRASATKYLANSIQRATAWHVLSELHDHRLYYLHKLPTNMHWCDSCSKRILEEAYRCRTCDFDVCLSCLVKHMPLHPAAGTEIEHDHATGDDDNGYNSHKSAQKRSKKSKNGKRSKHHDVDDSDSDDEEYAQSRRRKQSKSKGSKSRGKSRRNDSEDDSDNESSGDERQHNKSSKLGRKSKLKRNPVKVVDATLILPRLHDHPLFQIREKPSRSKSSSRKKKTSSAEICDNCDEIIEGDYFDCVKCDFSSCIKCTADASIPASSSHFLRGLHKHVVVFQESKETDDGVVHWCNTCSKRCKDYVFRCDACDYDCCVDCFYAACGPPIYHPNDLAAFRKARPKLLTGANRTQR